MDISKNHTVKKALEILFILLVILLVIYILGFFWSLNMEKAERSKILRERQEITNLLEKNFLNTNEKKQMSDLLSGEKALKYNLTDEEMMKIMNLLNR